ncbi:dynein axonemal assembly factor 8-like [Bufo gargarizans]|uniref:dynein axonemal assembly factor 8-like n=1 Tax=Bufo gargarizans TaxID=30331 RepID=UPI001CF343E2|nr:dynein axonemal assembly factor 8-like [Bufo gargarizans]
METGETPNMASSRNRPGAHELELFLSSVTAPSLDSDTSSLSDLELEELEVFQRDDCHLSDVSGDEDDDSIIKVLPAPEIGQTGGGGAVLSDIVGSLNPPDSPGSPSDCPAVSCSNMDETREDPTHGAPSQITAELDNRERIAVDRLVKPKNGQKDYNSHEAGVELFPLPSLQLIDQEDLETILQRLTDEVKLSISAKHPEEALPPSIPSMENTTKKRQEQIMEQLGELSARQSQARSPHQCLKGEHVDNEVVNSESWNSRPNGNEKKMKMVHQRRGTENNPTVFIDLRVTSSTPNLMTGGGGEPVQKIPRRADVPQYVSVHTGKSALLRQLRNSKMRSRSPPDRDPQRPVISSPEPPKKTTSPQEQGLNTKVEVGSCSPQNKEEIPEKDTKEESPRKKSEEPRKAQESRSTEEQSQREKRHREKKSRQTMQSQLEGMRPRSSVRGRQTAAEQTPVLFHLEASYGPEMDTLPASGRVEALLLTIRLSRCGQVLAPGQHISRSALLMANAYNALLAWLLSLVASLNLHYEGDAPFQVLGLQQMWREEGLALYACVSPREASALKSTKARKHKGKEDFRGTSSFYQQVSRFLSNHTLQSVAPWKESVMEQLQGQLFPLNLEVPVVKLSSIVMLNPDPQAVEKVFSSPSGFFWQTLETEEKLSPLAPEFFKDGEIEVVPIIMYDTLLHDSVAFHHALHLILTAGLDVCGVRLLYPEVSALRPNIYTIPPSYAEGDMKSLPVLAMALRGSHAGSTWESISGPCDPQLARQTDQNSLSALYGLTRESPLLHYSRTSGNILRDLSHWFGGRIPSNGVLNTRISDPSGRSLPLRARQKVIASPPALLTATTRGDVFLVVSPTVPPRAYGDVIDTCCQRGFSIHGIRRLRLSAKRGAMFNLSAAQVSVFCPNKPPAHPGEKLDLSAPEPPLHCLLLLLRKENAEHHTPALLQGLMGDLAEQGLLGEIRTNMHHPEDLDHNMCFHAVAFSDSLLQSLGGNLHSVPDSGTVWHMQSRQPFSLDPEVEQVVILTISGRQALQKAGHFLRQILRPKPKIQDSVAVGTGFQGFELLGLKWMPSLSWAQATAITPFEVGEHLWQQSVDQLASDQALVCALRRVQAFSTLADTIKELVPVTGKRQAKVIMSATPEVAFRQAVHFFTDKDLVSDSQRRQVLKYIAPPRIQSRSEGGGEHRAQTESIFTYMLSGPPLLYTVLLLKPGSWSSNLGKILRRIELQRFVLVAMKLVTLSTEDALQVIPTEAREDKDLCQAHCDYLTSAPALVLCLQRNNAILKLLDLLGPEDPKVCKAQDQFLWRAQYGTSSVRNAMYGSTSYQTAIREIKRFFPDGLVCDHQSIVLEAEQIPRMRRDVIFNSRTQRQALKNPLCNGGLSQSTGSLLTSALCQTTCLLFPSRALGGSSPAYIQGLEQLSSRAFRITAARLTVFDQSQAQFVAELYSLQDSLSAEFKAEIAGPCLLVAAQRDNAVTCFHSLMASSDNLQRDQKSMVFLLSPQSQRQASKIIGALFESLTPDSIHQIVPEAS